MSTPKRLHIFWSGRVQGVGFRYTVESAALELELTGWVMNLPDGRVESVVEGPEKKLKKFQDRIDQGLMKGYIQKTEALWESASGQFDDFRIRFY